MKTTFLIDFENVSPTDAGLVKPDSRVFVFVGERQSKLRLETAVALQPLGDMVAYIIIKGSGKNALDFHIAYFLGKLISEEPKTQYVVISKDTGFDPLVEYLKSNGVLCRRSRSFTEYYSAGVNVADRAEALAARLIARTSHRLATVKTMKSFIKSQLKPHTGGPVAEEVDAVYNDLLGRKIFTAKDKRIVYDDKE